MRFNHGSFNAADFLLLDGTTGRYDRYGLVLAIASAATLVAIVRSPPRRRVGLSVLLVACLAFLALSTSRQALLALAVGTGPLILLPGLGRVFRITASGVLFVAVALPFLVPTVTAHDIPPADEIPTSSAPSEPSPAPPVLTRASSAISLDPNRNFRLFLTFRLAPWAAVEEPILGFGPNEHTALDADARIQQFVSDAGTTWPWARRFTEDSNYASMVIQFGPLFAVGFLAVVATLWWGTLRRAILWRDHFALVALSVSLIVVAAALFGPAFEIRTASIFLWVFLFTAIAQQRSTALTSHR
jgi:hypothetical protein